MRGRGMDQRCSGLVRGRSDSSHGRGRDSSSVPSSYSPPSPTTTPSITGSSGHSTSMTQPPLRPIPCFDVHTTSSSQPPSVDSSYVTSSRKRLKFYHGKFEKQHTVSARITSIFKECADQEGWKWKNICKETKDLYWGEFKKYYEWDETMDVMVKDAWELLAGRRYSDMLSKWRGKGRPQHIPEDVWRNWQEHWNTSEFQVISEQASQNRLSEPAGLGTGPSRHVGDSLPFLEHRRLMTQREGHDPGDLKFFKEMHMKEGKWVDEKSKLIDAQVNEVLATEFLHASDERSQSEAPTPSTKFEDERRAFQKVLQATSKDRRVYGFGARGSVLFPSDSSSSSTAYSQFDEVRLREQLIADMQRTMEDQITERVEPQFQERERKLKEEQELQRQDYEQRMKQMEEQMQTIFRQMSQSSQSEQPNTSTRNSPHSH